jgi:hypothetical protein
MTLLTSSILSAIVKENPFFRQQGMRWKRKNYKEKKSVKGGSVGVSPASLEIVR